MGTMETMLSEEGFICLAVYRPRQDLLVRQVSSIRAQTQRNWRCIIGIDGADEIALADVQLAVAGDPRFIVREYEQNVGFYANFSRLLDEVPQTAKWVALSDQDDEWFPEKLATLLAELPRASLAVGQVIVAPADGASHGTMTKREVSTLPLLFFDNQVTGAACVFDRQLLSVALPFPAPTDLAFHDHWLGVCALASHGVVVIDVPVQYYLQHSSNVIGEERRLTLGHRLKNLFARSEGGARGAITYLRDHRWGWRVNMAQSLLAQRVGSTSLSDRTFLEAVANSQISIPFIRSMLGAIITRKAPRLRTFALLVGAIAWSVPVRARNSLQALLGPRPEHTRTTTKTQKRPN